MKNDKSWSWVNNWRWQSIMMFISIPIYFCIRHGYIHWIAFWLIYFCVTLLITYFPSCMLWPSKRYLLILIFKCFFFHSESTIYYLIPPFSEFFVSIFIVSFILFYYVLEKYIYFRKLVFHPFCLAFVSFYASLCTLFWSSLHLFCLFIYICLCLGCAVVN